MLKCISLILTLFTLILCKSSYAQVLENYSIYSFAPGISSARESSEYSGFSMTAQAAAGTGYFHGEVSSTLGFGPEVWSRYPIHFIFFTKL